MHNTVEVPREGLSQSLSLWKAKVVLPLEACVLYERCVRKVDGALQPKGASLRATLPDGQEEGVVHWNLSTAAEGKTLSAWRNYAV